MEMNQICPACGESILIADNKSKYPRFRRCKKCEYKEFFSIQRTSRKIKKADAVDPNSKVNHDEPTDQQLRSILKKKKGKEIVKEKIETFTPIEKAEVQKSNIPKITSEEEPEKKKWIPSKMTDEEKEKLWARGEWIKEQRRKMSIERLLKKLGQQKYSGLIGKKINIYGELYEVKPNGKPDERTNKPSSRRKGTSK